MLASLFRENFCRHYRECFGQFRCASVRLPSADGQQILSLRDDRFARFADHAPSSRSLSSKRTFCDSPVFRCARLNPRRAPNGAPGTLYRLVAFPCSSVGYNDLRAKSIADTLSS